uniref:Retroviral envelope protein GP41-like domain-containing protein n=1 Tax=Monodelphis domestica TaxID=13616 RepID=K7E362_MONDO
MERSGLPVSISNRGRDRFQMQGEQRNRLTSLAPHRLPETRTRSRRASLLSPVSYLMVKRRAPGSKATLVNARTLNTDITFTLMTFTILTLLNICHAEVYWSIVPKPPILRMLTWMDKPPLVYVNNTDWLPHPILAKRVPLESEGALYNYSGSTVYPPFCMSFRNSFIGNSFCVPRRQQAWIVKNATDNSYIGVGMGVIGMGDELARKTFQPKHPANKYLCPNQIGTVQKELPWTDCSVRVPRKVKMPATTDFNIYNWAPRLRCGRSEQLTRLDKYTDYEKWHMPCQNFQKIEDLLEVDMAGSRLAIEAGPIQNTQWKIVAATQPIYKFKVKVKNSGLDLEYDSHVNVTACVFAPYVMLVGNNLRIFKNDQGLYEINCTKCRLHQCLSPKHQDSYVAIMYHPPLMWVPVNLTETWASTPTVHIVQKAFNMVIHRSKRMVFALVGAVVSVIAMITSLTTATLALTSSIQNHEFIQEVVSNSSKLWHTQQSIDLAYRDELDSLKDAVFWLGKEVEALHTRITYPCHYNQTGYCITPLPYDNVSYEWQLVVQHIKGAWGSHNSTLDIIKLQQQINKLDQIVYENEAANIAANWEATLSSLDPQNWFGRANLTSIGTIILFILLAIGLIILCSRSCKNRAYIRGILPELARSYHTRQLVPENVELNTTGL